MESRNESLQCGHHECEGGLREETKLMEPSRDEEAESERRSCMNGFGVKRTSPRL